MRNLVRSQTTKRLRKLDEELQRVVLKGGLKRGPKHGVRKNKDADDIHDLRVSVRRLIQELRVFEEWFEPGPVKKIRGSLRKLMARCAAVRNCDIAVEVLQTAGWRNPELFAGLEEERRRTRAELARTLASWRRRGRVRRWREHLRVGRVAAGAESGGRTNASPGEAARRLLPAMIEELFRAGREAARPDSSQQRMHGFRLEAKRVRYTLELFEPVYGRKAKRIVESLKGLQEKLGAINDCATTLEMIRRDRAAAAAVRRLAREREAEFRVHWKKHFRPRERVRWKAVLGAADGKK
jgi:CHAD domain-containing protein